MNIPLTRNTVTRKAGFPRQNWAAETGLPGEAVLEVDGYIRKFAWTKAGQAVYAGLEVEDLLQEGRAGALRAAAKFNSGAGAKFLTYAAWWIRAGIIEALQRGIVSSPKGQQRPFVASLDEPLRNSRTHESEAISAMDLLSDLTQDPFEDAAMAEESARVRKLLPRLDARTREVLARHAGLDGHAEQRLPDIARDMGVSRQRVGQIFQQGLGCLRGDTMTWVD